MRNGFTDILKFNEEGEPLHSGLLFRSLPRDTPEA